MLRKALVSIFPFLVTLTATGTQAQITTELAGNPLTQYPHFEYVRAFNSNAPVSVAIDTTRFTSVAGQTCDVYVTDARTAAQWASNPTLTDVRPGGAQPVSFTGADIQANTVQVAAAGILSADAGTGLGVGYDVVLDCNQNGALDAADVIDGLGDEAGLYRVHDTTVAGPLAVTELQYALSSADGTAYGIPGNKLAQNLYYPSNVSALGQLPLIFISRGNGHDYRWYDHIGNHMASYGYVVMSHDNNTEPGTQSAAITTLGHTDAFIDLAASGAIASGDLVGHIDTSRIVWIGHSRGGEGVAIAYDRLVNGSYTPVNYTRSDIKLISSMLPTDFYGSGSALPSNAPAMGIRTTPTTTCGPLPATWMSTVPPGARFARPSTSMTGRRPTASRLWCRAPGHGWFHDEESAGAAFTGPCAIGPPNDLTHDIQLGHFLPLIKHYVEGNVPAFDFLTRQYERFRPIGVTTSDPCVVVTHEYRNAAPVGNFVIDDYQSQPSPGVSSSGAQVLFAVQNLTEDRLDDNDSSFHVDGVRPVQWRDPGPRTDDKSGRRLRLDRPGPLLRVGDSRRAARLHRAYLPVVPRRPRDAAPQYARRHEDLTFTVTLRDLWTTSTINIGAYGGGLEQPYARAAAGTTRWRRSGSALDRLPQQRNAASISRTSSPCG